MAYLALYRRYRPSTFENLIGQEHIVKTLVNQIESGRLGHAYLFTGTRGTGKTSAAKIFAKAINCLSPKNGSPCGECEVCKALSDPSNIDVIEIDAASNNGVNEIRDLREKVQYPPVSCKYKVYIIDEVHMLTGAAFNALLKTLEEPPKHAVFILATTEVHKIPATILSRCMRFDFRLISTEQIAELISKIYDEQGKSYENEAVFAIADAGEGSIRDALSIADIALSYGKGKLTYDDVMEILGSSNTELLVSFVKNLIDGNCGNVLEIIDKLSALGKSMGVLNKDLIALIRNLLVIKSCKNADKLLSLPPDKFNVLKNVAELTTEERLIRILTIFADNESSLKYSTHPRIVFETSAIKAARPDADYDFDALLSRIKELENKLNDFNKGVVVKENVKPIYSEIKPQAEKPLLKSVSEIGVQEIRGKLLSSLRDSGCEMLWNILQNVKIKIDKDVITLIAKSSDVLILDKPDNREKIISSIKGCSPFTLNIEQSIDEKNLDKIDMETEKLIKNFGSEFVIVKD